MSETAGPYDNLCLVLLETPKLVFQSASVILRFHGGPWTFLWSGMWPSPSTVGTAIQSSPPALPPGSLPWLHPPSLPLFCLWFPRAGGLWTSALMWWSLDQSWIFQSGGASWARDHTVLRSEGREELLAAGPWCPGWCKRGRAYTTEDGLQAEHQGPGPFSANDPWAYCFSLWASGPEAAKWEQMSWARWFLKALSSFQDSFCSISVS